MSNLQQYITFAHSIVHLYHFNKVVSRATSYFIASQTNPEVDGCGTVHFIKNDIIENANAVEV